MELDFKTLYNQAPCGYLYTTEDGTLIDVNDTFLAFTGYSREEIIENKRFEDFLTIGGKIYYETHFAPLLNMQGEVSEINFDFIRKDGTRFPVLINAIKQSANEKQHSYIQFIVIDITQRKQYELELMNAKRKSEELLTQLSKVNKELTSNIQVIAEQKNVEDKIINSIISLQEHDREYFAEDLHEGLAQTLTGLFHHFSAIEFNTKVIEDDELKSQISILKEYIRQSIDDTRKLAQDLMPRAMMADGLVSSIRNYINKLEAKVDFDIEIHSDIEIAKTNKDIEIIIYRIIVSILEKVKSAHGTKKVTIEFLSESDSQTQIEIFGKFNYRSAFDIKELSRFQKRIELLSGQMLITHNKKKEITTINLKF